MHSTENFYLCIKKFLSIVRTQKKLYNTSTKQKFVL